MRKLLISAFIAAALVTLIGYTGNQCYPEKTSLKPDSEDKIRSLFEEITLLNLVNGLNLTEDQIKQILQYNKEAQLLREQMETENGRIIDNVISAYAELKSTLEKNEGIPKDIERQAFMMEQEAKRIMEELMGGVTSIEKELADMLLESQVEVINNFNPCLIPPKDLKDPVRAGQAANSEQGLDHLRRIRKIPPEVYEEKKPEIVERHLETIQKHAGKLNDEEKKREAERLIKVMDKARAMSDKDFELNGPDLAREFISGTKKTVGRDKELREELEKLHQERRGGPGRIGKFLINPRIVPILEKRLELMKNAKQMPPADLDKIKTR
ncbi:MAG: hypothetical protein AB1599_01615 [Planctomycetota bacterium]